MRKVILAFFFMAISTNVIAQDMATCSDSVFRLKMRKLVSKGNHYYDISNTDGIRQMLDSISAYILFRSHSGLLNENDSLEFTADRFKLEGSYHYENSYYDSTSYAKAHTNYMEALKIYESHSSFHNNLQCGPMIHRELAVLYYKERDFQEAYSQMKEAYEAFKNAADLGVICENDTDYLDIQTQMAICQARMGNTKEALVTMDKLIRDYQPSDVHYGEALRKKAKILMLREEQGGKPGRKEALDCYRRFFELKRKDALDHFLGMNSEAREMYWNRIRPFVTDCYRMEGADAGFLYDVTLFAKGLLLQLDSAGRGRQNIYATWQMLQDSLEDDACAIEFIQYEKYGQQKMGALVLRKTGAPEFVNMADPDSIIQYKINDKLTVEKVLKSVRNDRLSGESGRINSLYRDSVGLFNYIWNAQLISAIGNSSNVWFSPDGYIHQLAIEYMLPKRLSHIVCHRLSATKELLKGKSKQDFNSALIIGDIDYYGKYNPQVNGNDEVAYNYLKKGGKTGFSPLKHSAEEVEEIRNVREAPGDTLLIGSSASEQAFRNSCSNYSLIHISSHGMFDAAATPQGTDLKTNLRDNSLSHSLIAFAGISANLDSDTFNPKENMDGILSAHEISSLNFSKADLVVLCCCETGLGFVTPDGVYGIQRGLKNAGAKAIICTLWDIDDEASCFFMIRFHQYLKESNDLYKAFHQARESMKGKYSDPCNRDAFILIDAI